MAVSLSGPGGSPTSVHWILGGQLSWLINRPRLRWISPEYPRYLFHYLDTWSFGICRVWTRGQGSWPRSYGKKAVA